MTYAIAVDTGTADKTIVQLWKQRGIEIEALQEQLAEAKADYLRVKETNDELCFEIRKAKAYISGLESEKCVCEEITDLRRIICDMLRKQL